MSPLVELVVSCPFPAHAVSNNGRLHWGAKARLTRELRTWGYQAAIEAVLERPAPSLRRVLKVPGQQFIVDWELAAPTRWDDDNSISACKPLRDGIADALGINDRKITTGRVWWRDPRPREPHSAIAHIRQESA